MNIWKSIHDEPAVVELQAGVIIQYQDTECLSGFIK